MTPLPPRMFLELLVLPLGLVVAAGPELIRALGPFGGLKGTVELGSVGAVPAKGGPKPGVAMMGAAAEEEDATGEVELATGRPRKAAGPAGALGRCTVAAAGRAGGRGAANPPRCAGGSKLLLVPGG